MATSSDDNEWQKLPSDQKVQHKVRFDHSVSIGTHSRRIVGMESTSDRLRRMRETLSFANLGSKPRIQQVQRPDEEVRHRLERECPRESARRRPGLRRRGTRSRQVRVCARGINTRFVHLLPLESSVMWPRA